MFGTSSQFWILNFFNVSWTYLTWQMKIPWCDSCIPYPSYHIFFHHALLELLVHPWRTFYEDPIITYKQRIIMSSTSLFMYMVDSFWLITIPFSTKYLSLIAYQALGACLSLYNASSTCTEILFCLQHQILVAALNTLLVQFFHSRMHSSHQVHMINTFFGMPKIRPFWLFLDYNRCLCLVIIKTILLSIALCHKLCFMPLNSSITVIIGLVTHFWPMKFSYVLFFWMQFISSYIFSLQASFFDVSSMLEGSMPALDINE